MNIKSQFLKVEKYIIVILVFVCGFLMNRTVIYAEGTKQPIKVGYIDYAGFIEKNNDGTMEGYAVSYLNEIGKYTNWKYEYRYDTWDKCLEALKKGRLTYFVVHSTRVNVGRILILPNILVE